MVADSRTHARGRWLAWDGRTLSWSIDAAAAATFELAIDGVAFQRFAQDGGAGNVFDLAFDYGPAGNSEIEFSLRDERGAALAAPWRVRFGAAAPAGQDQWRGKPAVLRPIPQGLPLPARAWSDAGVAVVVPIHNAAASVQRCLSAMLRWTPPGVRLILIDDASTDLAIAPLLARLAQRANVVLERNERNRGYTYSVNAGIARAGSADVVLLNSDTEVGPRWLQSLWFAAYGDATVGTVTAVSDNAGAFSVPELEQYCPIPPQWDLVTAQRAILQQAGMRHPQLPTGNGFCMYVKRELFARVGVMDAQAFPAGYGEENDFCQRAIAGGWRNVVAGNVLVRHERSASFGDARRAALGAQGMAVLRERWPCYEADVGATLFSFDRRVLGYRVRRAYAGAALGVRPRARVLTIAASGADIDAALAAPGAGYDSLALLAAPLELWSMAGGARQCIARADGDSASAAISTWLALNAIEAVLVRGDDALVRLLAERASAFGIAVVGAASELRAVTDRDLV